MKYRISFMHFENDDEATQSVHEFNRDTDEEAKEYAAEYIRSLCSEVDDEEFSGLAALERIDAIFRA